ncbi:YbaB/EbfC family nucleoid-associated protein [Limibaculum sp. M0105]|uniref:Nucleoid-associated protein H0I76_17645 n=1 Tax=Thermohalobaculum xanthum TaxID=2753746 RepID=A0A8J7M9V7_9RHOB|nr:YbaB/EbfC family nucleoid-associated protein [Thermohalobaculum xanthum]MBK0401024.1 YbaB/EbfC family nucleoid-associated protein [Thermohalobaculum xanthum]
MLKGLGDMAKLMREAQKMQERMAEAQSRIAEMTAEGTAGAGMVRATASGEGEVKGLKVDPSLIDGSMEKEVLEDLIVAAVNDAVRKAKEQAQEELSKLTEGLPLPPGFKFPGT